MKKTFALVILSLSLAGCTSQTSQPTVFAPVALPSTAVPVQPVTSTAIATEPSNALTNNTNQAHSKQQPLQIVLALDKTGSQTNNKIPNITIDQMRIIGSGILSRGGDLRTTSICTDSDKAMPRLYVEPATQTPIAPIQAETGENNVFAKAKLQDEHQVKIVAYQKQKNAYDQQQQSKVKTDKTQLDKFLTTVQPMLDKPASCTGSDMVGIVNRANLALHEPTAIGSPLSRKVLFLITDGEHNTTKDSKVPTLDAQTDLVIVSGGKGAGIFEPLKPVKFDSIDAAIAYILSR
jgi:uncharacterized protein YcfL